MWSAIVTAPKVSFLSPALELIVVRQKSVIKKNRLNLDHKRVSNDGRSRFSWGKAAELWNAPGPERKSYYRREICSRAKKNCNELEDSGSSNLWSLEMVISRQSFRAKISHHLASSPCAVGERAGDGDQTFWPPPRYERRLVLRRGEGRKSVPTANIVKRRAKFLLHSRVWVRLWLDATPEIDGIVTILPVKSAIWRGTFIPGVRRKGPLRYFGTKL